MYNCRTLASPISTVVTPAGTEHTHRREIDLHWAFRQQIQHHCQVRLEILSIYNQLSQFNSPATQCIAFSPCYHLFCSTDIQLLIYLCCQRDTPEFWSMEHSCKRRAACLTADHYISVQWLMGSTWTSNLEGNEQMKFQSFHLSKCTPCLCSK